MRDLPADLLDRARRGDPCAHAEIYNALAADIYRTAHGIVANAHDAEDAVHDVFLKVLDKLPRFRGEAAIATWVHRCAPAAVNLPLAVAMALLIGWALLRAPRC